MGILEIDTEIDAAALAVSSRPVATPDPALTPRLSPGLLGLAARPEFLADPPPPDRSGFPTLWERLSLSWREPQLARDLLAPRNGDALECARPVALSARLRGTG